MALEKHFFLLVFHKIHTPAPLPQTEEEKHPDPDTPKPIVRPDEGTLHARAWYVKPVTPCAPAVHHPKTQERTSNTSVPPAEKLVTTTHDVTNPKEITPNGPTKKHHGES